MDSEHLGEATINLGKEKLIVVFTIRARAQMRTAFGEGQSLSALIYGEDEMPFLRLLSIGLGRYHPHLSPEILRDMAIPLEPSRAAVVKALNWSIFGPDGPPKTATEKKAGKQGNPR